jgi:hypothetical protein
MSDTQKRYRAGRKALKKLYWGSTANLIELSNERDL